MRPLLRILLLAVAATANVNGHDPIREALLTSRDNMAVLVVNAVAVPEAAGNTFWNRLAAARQHGQQQVAANGTSGDPSSAEEPPEPAANVTETTANSTNITETDSSSGNVGSDNVSDAVELEKWMQRINGEKDESPQIVEQPTEDSSNDTDTTETSGEPADLGGEEDDEADEAPILHESKTDWASRSITATNETDDPSVNEMVSTDSQLHSTAILPSPTNKSRQSMDYGRQARTPAPDKYLDIVDAKTIIDEIWSDGNEIPKARSSDSDSEIVELEEAWDLMLDTEQLAALQAIFQELHGTIIEAYQKASKKFNEFVTAEENRNTVDTELVQIINTMLVYLIEEPDLFGSIIAFTLGDLATNSTMNHLNTTKADRPATNNSQNETPSIPGPSEELPEGRKTQLKHSISASVAHVKYDRDFDAPILFTGDALSSRSAADLLSSLPPLKPTETISFKPTGTEEGAVFDGGEFGLDLAAKSGADQGTMELSGRLLHYHGTVPDPATGIESGASVVNDRALWRRPNSRPGPHRRPHHTPTIRGADRAEQTETAGGPAAVDTASWRPINTLADAIELAMLGDFVTRSKDSKEDALMTAVDRDKIASVIEDEHLCDFWARTGACSCHQSTCQLWSKYIRKMCPIQCKEPPVEGRSAGGRLLGASLRDGFGGLGALSRSALAGLLRTLTAPGISAVTRCRVTGHLRPVTCRADTPHLPHPFFCECFYHCEGNKARVHACPSGLHYAANNSSKLCVATEKSSCHT